MGIWLLNKLIFGLDIYRILLNGHLADEFYDGLMDFLLVFTIHANCLIQMYRYSNISSFNCIFFNGPKSKLRNIANNNW